MDYKFTLIILKNGQNTDPWQQQDYSLNEDCQATPSMKRDQEISKQVQL